ncbi:gamma-parvin isoform X9 [Tupaia chinensis]|uniref:gamma-parvin isoform X9 n=1 Tax=Tupaia chinensis TaxID=246437 RepID=UPI000FFBE314|nr:gamma-parvin isoform X9 [Tupaia chinensis]XP_027628521.1 gamma-parvin isoform X9 [Tupaia chinensis]
METESLYNLLQLPKQVDLPAEEAPPQGEKKKYLSPTSRKDPKFEELQKVLMEWINGMLLPEHIVVRSLEEDMFDGLILHHLFQKLAALKLEVEEIALTAASQRRKLAVVLEAANRSLQVEETQAKWSVDTIFNKDLLATLHLLVALATRFQPSLQLPPSVQVEVITIESTKSGLKSEKSVEQITEGSTDKDRPSKDVFDELFKLAPEKVDAVKEVRDQSLGSRPPACVSRGPGKEMAPCFTSAGHRELCQPEAGAPGPVCAEPGHPVCRWSHLTLAHWTTGRLLPALKGIPSYSQLACRNVAQCHPGPGAAEG